MDPKRDGILKVRKITNIFWALKIAAAKKKKRQSCKSGQSTEQILPMTQIFCESVTPFTVISTQPKVPK